MITSITYEELKNTPLTDEEKAELRALRDREPEPDDENPDITPEQIAEFKRVAAERKEERNKQNVTLRLSPQALAKARSLGKGYTSVLSRILEKALNDPDTIRANL